MPPTNNQRRRTIIVATFHNAIKWKKVNELQTEICCVTHSTLTESTFNEIRVKRNHTSYNQRKKRTKSLINRGTLNEKLTRAKRMRGEREREFEKCGTQKKIYRVKQLLKLIWMKREWLISLFNRLMSWAGNSLIPISRLSILLFDVLALFSFRGFGEFWECVYFI